MSDKIIKVGNYSPSGHNASSIVDPNGISPTVMENHGTVTAIIETQKNPKVLQVANIVDDTNIGFKNPQRGRVYDPEGLAPALNCCQGGGLEPKIIQKFGDRGTSQYSIRDIAHTIPSNPMSDRGQLLLEPTMCINEESKLKNSLEQMEQTNEWRTIIGNKQKNPFRGSVDECSPCITSASGMGGGMTPMLTDAPIETAKTDNFIEQLRGHSKIRYRIRKLTPKEAFRLMDVEDEDIAKIQATGLSNSAQYKLAGNSIVISPLYHIFRKMFVETESEELQLSLF